MKQEDFERIHHEVSTEINNQYADLSDLYIKLLNKLNYIDDLKTKENSIVFERVIDDLKETKNENEKLKAKLEDLEKQKTTLES